MSNFRTIFSLAIFSTILSFGAPSRAATLTFCASWAYSFTDQGYGEDGLVHLGWPGTFGVKEAAHARVFLYKDGSLVTHGYLNSSGCLSVNRQAGNYELYVRSAAEHPNGLAFEVHRTQSSGPEYFYSSHPMTGGSDFTRYVNIGPTGDPVVNAAAVSAQFMKESHIGLDSGQTYTIIAEASSSFYDVGDGIVRIGETSGVSHAYSKYTIGHELGHAVQDRLFGMLNNDYTLVTSSQELCRCDHVAAAAERPHCLQSLEEGASAQNEGFGHFIALDAMNNDAQSDGVFVYYKEFKHPSGIVEDWPLGIDGRAKHKWMRNHCPTSTPYRGTELDWMGFYFALHTLGTSSSKFYFTQIRDAYLDTCGTSCSGQQATWTDLTDSVENRYGPTSSRLEHWSLQGANYGVDQ